MTALKTQLHALAEQIAGSRIHVDITYLVSAEHGTEITVTADSAEAALARFIADYLEAQTEAEPQPEPAAPVVTAPAPVAPAPPSNGNGHGHGAPKPRGRAAIGAANRARVAELHAQGQSVEQIAAASGLSDASVYAHLKALREESDRAAPAAPFRN